MSICAVEIYALQRFVDGVPYGQNQRSTNVKSYKSIQILQIFPKSFKSIQIFQSFSDENIEKNASLDKNNKTYKKSRLQMI